MQRSSPVIVGIVRGGSEASRSWDFSTASLADEKVRRDHPRARPRRAGLRSRGGGSQHGTLCKASRRHSLESSSAVKFASCSAAIISRDAFRIHIRRNSPGLPAFSDLTALKNLNDKFDLDAWKSDSFSARIYSPHGISTRRLDQFDRAAACFDRPFLDSCLRAEIVGLTLTGD